MPAGIQTAGVFTCCSWVANLICYLTSVHKCRATFTRIHIAESLTLVVWPVPQLLRTWGESKVSTSGRLTMAPWSSHTFFLTGCPWMQRQLHAHMATQSRKLWPPSLSSRLSDSLAPVSLHFNYKVFLLCSLQRVIFISRVILYANDDNGMSLLAPPIWQITSQQSVSFSQSGTGLIMKWLAMELSLWTER